MGFEPQKFFIGLIDFFSILLPGALLAFVLKVISTDKLWAGRVVRGGVGQG
jgi:hypothetical protein